MLDKPLNIFFFFTTIFVFLLFAEGNDHMRFLSAIGLSIPFVILVYILNWLTLDGVTSATLFGIIAYGFAGFFGATVILGFFITSSILSINQNDGINQIYFRRNGTQVWANGFWFAFWVIFWFITDSIIFLIAASAAVSFSTADTWGSEIGGKRVQGTTWSFGAFNKVEAGTDGGISVVGTIATFCGASFIGGVFWLFFPQMPTGYLLIIILLGLIGSFVDSWLGTYIQGKSMSDKIIAFSKNKIRTFDNNLTNWIASGVSSILAIIAFLLIS